MTNMTVSERTVADLKAKLAERDRKIDALTAETTTLRRCIGETPCKCVFAEDGSVFNECDRCTILRIAGEPTINGADVLAERDRRIAELEGALAKLGDVEQYGTGRAFGLYCDVMVFANAALSGSSGEWLERKLAEARRKALLGVAEAALEKYGASPTQHWLAKLAQEADHA